MLSGNGLAWFSFLVFWLNLMEIRLCAIPSRATLLQGEEETLAAALEIYATGFAGRPSATPLPSAGLFVEPQIFNHILPLCAIHPLPSNGRVCILECADMSALSKRRHVAAIHDPVETGVNRLWLSGARPGNVLSR